jgi:hypothetical protein
MIIGFIKCFANLVDQIVGIILYRTSEIYIQSMIRSDRNLRSWNGVFGFMTLFMFLLTKTMKS